MNKPTVIILHHSASPRSVRVGDINEWHKKRWPDFVSRRGYHVGYHYVIEQDGKITQTRDHNEEGAHCIGMNRSSIGICFVGNFNEDKPRLVQVAAFENLYKKLVAEFGDLPVKPHRAYSKTDCFGTRIADNYFSVTAKQLKVIELLKQKKAYLESVLKKRTMK